MDERDIVLVYSDDWLRMYVDGKLVHNHHPLSGDEMLDELGIKYSVVQISPHAMVAVCDQKTNSLDADRDIINDNLDWGDGV